MAGNKHLYTVYHSLDNHGAFDAPIRDATSQVHPLQGKYYQEHTEWPKWVHAKGKASVEVADAAAEAALRAVWAAEDAKLVELVVPKVDARAAMLERAKELGLKVDGRTSDKKLAYLIEEAEAK